MKKNEKLNSGITLIALVITIIVLIILAAVSIALLTGENGILTKAKNSSDETQLAEEKERVKLVATELKIEKVQGNEVNKQEFQKIVDGQFGKDKAVGDIKENTYIITVNKTNNVYTIDENGNIGYPGDEEKLKKDDTPGILEGAGTEENPYTIDSIEDLVAFSYNVNSGTDLYEGKTVALGRSLYFSGLFDSYANPDSKYELETRVDKTNSNRINQLGYIPNESAEKTIKELMTTGEGFVPIGNAHIATNTFKGKFDGKNNFIAGIHISKIPGSAIGFFGVIKSYTSIKNFGINGGDIFAEVSYTGGIVGQIDIPSIDNTNKKFEIVNCYNKANIETKNAQHGGIVGKIDTSDTNSQVEFVDCYNTGEILGGISGGIVGSTYDYQGILNVKNSYNTGNIDSSSLAGGIIATSSSINEISNCYNTGNINSSSIAGGIIAGSSSINEISNCYNTGNISSTSDPIGGVIGVIYSNKVKKMSYCYNEGNIIGEANAAGLAQVEVEIMENCYNTGEIHGKSDSLGLVYKCSNNMTNCYNLGKVVSDNSIVAGLSWEAANITDCYNIGEIHGKSNSLGLVYKCNDMTNCYNLGKVVSDNSIVAGLSWETANITNCYNKGNLTCYGENSPIAGIAYLASGNISECYNTGTIIGLDLLAGIVAQFSGDSIENCYNTGELLGGTTGTGGIVATTYESKIINCYNTVDISVTGGPVGGICGSSSRGEIINCYNFGKISGGGSLSGGISGSAEYVYNSYNIGDIVKQNSVTGGITGSGNCYNCYNKGKVINSKNPTGGIIGVGKEIYYSYNEGDIESDNLSGGIAGICSEKVISCYNKANVKGTSTNPVGGIISYMSNPSTIIDNHNVGNVTGGEPSNTGEIIGSGTAGSDCTYLIKPTNANANGATGKTQAEMDEIMNLQKFVDLMNSKVDENNSNTANTHWKKWKLENGVPVFAE